MDDRNLLQKSDRFTENFVSMNNLKDFHAWRFEPGMLYNSADIWWVDKKRDTKHEGIDLAYYLQSNGQKSAIDTKTAVPAIIDGIVVKIDDDFIGKSIYTTSGTHDRGVEFYTIYAHVVPDSRISEGAKFSRGDLVARLANPTEKNLKTPAHLHITFAWVPEQIDYKRLNWGYISRREGLSLVDPERIICYNRVI